MRLDVLRRELAQGAETIGGLVAGVSPSEARVRPAPDAWSLLEVVCHLHDEEREDFRPRLDVVLHRGAGAYICGEETALLSSLEGYRGQPRLRPPFPAVEGLYASPTAINNVETLANVPLIIGRGVEWFSGIGREKNTGPKLYCVSGHVKRPGVYELPMEVTLRELVFDHAGGVPEGRRLKAVIPGGSSVPVLTEAHLDVILDFDSLLQAGSMLGSGGVTVMEEGTSMVWAALRLMEFFYHESCGKCTPCREGTSWLVQTMRRIVSKRGRMEDLETLTDLCQNIAGRTVCAFGDAAIAPVLSTLQHWRDEYEELIREAEADGLAGLPELILPMAGRH